MPLAQPLEPVLNFLHWLPRLRLHASALLTVPYIIPLLNSLWLAPWSAPGVSYRCLSWYKARNARVQIQALLLTICVTLDTLVKLAEPQFHYL